LRHRRRSAIFRRRSRPIGAGHQEAAARSGERPLRHRMPAFCTAELGARPAATRRSGHFGQCRGIILAVIQVSELRQRLGRSVNRHVRLSGDLCRPRPLGHFRVPGVAARRPGTPPSARTSHGLRVRQLSVLPEQRSDRHRATSSPGRSWRIGRLLAFQMLWEPELGANVFRRPQTQRDVARTFSQVKGSPLDSVRR